jgi:hypothetical protein
VVQQHIGQNASEPDGNEQFLPENFPFSSHRPPPIEILIHDAICLSCLVVHLKRLRQAAGEGGE